MIADQSAPFLTSFPLCHEWLNIVYGVGEITEGPFGVSGKLLLY